MKILKMKKIKTFAKKNKIEVYFKFKKEKH